MARASDTIGAVRDTVRDRFWTATVRMLAYRRASTSAAAAAPRPR